MTHTHTQMHKYIHQGGLKSTIIYFIPWYSEI